MTFKPGQSGNPSGRPPVPPDIREARIMNKQDFARLLNQMMKLSIPEVTEIRASEDAPTSEVMVAQIVLAAAAEGDPKRADFILDRWIGKVKDEVEVTAIQPTVIKYGGEEIHLGIEEKSK